MNFDPSVVQAFQSFMRLLQLPQATSAAPPSAPTPAQGSTSTELPHAEDPPPTEAPVPPVTRYFEAIQTQLPQPSLRPVATSLSWEPPPLLSAWQQTRINLVELDHLDLDQSTDPLVPRFHRPTMVGTELLKATFLNLPPLWAQAPPSLGPLDNSPLSVFETDSLTNEQFVNLEVHVYLPTAQANASTHLVFNLANSFIDYLDNHSLRFMYRLPSTTKIIHLIDKVSADMVFSPRKWDFRNPSSSLRQLLSRAETLHLQLLALLNRGIRRKADNLILLTRQPGNSDLALGDLFTAENALKFCKPDITIWHRRLVLNLIVARSGITGLAKCGSQSTTLRRHSCLPAMMHSIFSPANEANKGTSDWAPPRCDSDGETDDEMEVADSLFDSDIENIPPTPTPAVPPHNLPFPGAKQFYSPLPICKRDHSSPVLISVTGKLFNPSHEFAAHIAASLRISLPTISCRYAMLFDTTDVPKAIFEAASSTGARSEAELVVEGFTVTELAQALIAEIKIAASATNFGPILAANLLTHFQHSSQWVPGVDWSGSRERGSLYCLSMVTEHSSQWFLPRFDGRCSIATTMSLAASSFVGETRRNNLAVLGCLVSLLLIFGIAPEPLSPSVIHWAANDCELRSLNWEFVQEWHPDLRALLEQWTAVGPTGDITDFQSYFTSFHDLQIASLEMRDQAQHDALTHDILYTALIGQQPPTHNELKAFLTGLHIPCLNGFNFMEVPILGTGSGAPCPGLLEEAMPTFSKLIPFDQIDLPAFRPMALCWASTGSPHLEFEDHQQLIVHFVAPNDYGYHQDSTICAAFMKQGLICFRTCFRIARIPVIHLADICSQSYPARDVEGNAIEPFTLKAAIDNWLLLQILTGIGRHSVL
ncbi:hypothetical protein C8R45DRAFT_1128395 [Mycena sanguinolenta]|nr:hypothetical protein C8R45DRAFT_1128395 [Mycena sanguinolenta]